VRQPASSSPGAPTVWPRTSSSRRWSRPPPWRCGRAGVRRPGAPALRVQPTEALRQGW